MSEIPTINLGYATTDVFGLLHAQIESIGEKIDIAQYNTKLLLTLEDFYKLISHPIVKGDIHNVNILKSSGLVVTKINGEYFGLMIKGESSVEQSGFVCEKITADRQYGVMGLHRETFPINFGGEQHGSKN